MTSPTSSAERRAPARGARLADYDYELPTELIAQHPPATRSASRLLLLEGGGKVGHHQFLDLPKLLSPGDLLVVNDTRVIPARIRFRHADRPAEILLLHPVGGDEWECLARPARRLAKAGRVELPGGLWAKISAATDGALRVSFSPRGRLAEVLVEIGETPLPPYINERLADPERYQTVYARVPGSAAAPTAGLHFDSAILSALEERGIKLATLTLRIGLDTFQPIRSESLDDHHMHTETYSVPPATVEAIAGCRRRGGRVVAVGTTTARALEAAAGGQLEGQTDLFIRPGFEFRSVDVMLTNFHLPRSTLLVMVSAFGGRTAVRAAYRAAIKCGYRFYSFGDAMLIERA